jgi:Putative metallopeptidase
VLASVLGRDRDEAALIPSMKRPLLAAALALVVSCCAVSAPAVAQTKGKVTVKYETSLFLGIQTRMQQRQVLQELAQFLSPLRLPRDLQIVTQDCGAQSRPYVTGGPVTICYELINQIEETAAKIAPQDQAERVVTGSFIEVALHETAHAIFDIFQVPIWGRAEDAADRLAALIMVEFGEDMERTAIIGAAELFEYSAKTGKTWTGSDFADTGSPDAQRYYNFLCIGAAADPLNFGGWMDAQWVDKSKSIIPKDRADDCVREYQQIRTAFNLRIMPYVDADTLAAVKATQWLNWTPGK